jgi:hypothetical protein
MKCNGAGRLELLTASEHAARGEHEATTGAGVGALVATGMAAATGFGLVNKLIPGDGSLAAGGAVAAGLFVFAICLLIPRVRAGLVILLVKAIVAGLVLGGLAGLIALFGWLYPEQAGSTPTSGHTTSPLAPVTDPMTSPVSARPTDRW